MFLSPFCHDWRGGILNKGFSFIELMVAVVIIVMMVGVVYVTVKNDSNSLVVTVSHEYESSFATHAIAFEGDTVKINIHRALKGVPYWIVSLRCNETAPTLQNQLFCLADLQHQTEGNTLQRVKVLCDQSRRECDGEGDCINHESTGCVPNGPLTQNEP